MNNHVWYAHITVLYEYLQKSFYSGVCINMYVCVFTREIQQRLCGEENSCSLVIYFCNVIGQFLLQEYWLLALSGVKETRDDVWVLHVQLYNIVSLIVLMYDCDILRLMV